MIGRPIAIPDVPRRGPDERRSRRRRRSSRASPSGVMSSSAIGADSMPPTRDPRNSTPLAVPRSRGGNQREKARTMLGNAPASPAPNRKRIASERSKPARRAGQHREAGPPQHDARQHAPRTAHVAEPARGHLEQRVRQRERAEDDAHLQDREVQILHDGRRRRRDADAIEIGDDGQQEGKREHAAANAGHGLVAPSWHESRRWSQSECNKILRIMPSAADLTSATAKVRRRLIPFLFLLYIVAYLDRINVGFAALQMNEALGFSASDLRARRRHLLSELRGVRDSEQRHPRARRRAAAGSRAS